MKHVFCSRFTHRLTMVYSLARKAAIITLILHVSWDPDDLIGCLFIFWKHLSSMKNLSLCFEKNTMKISFTHVGKPAGLGTIPALKQSLIKPLPLCKIACVSTVNVDTVTPHTVIMHHVHRSELAYSIIMLISIFVKKCYCKLDSS